MNATTATQPNGSFVMVPMWLLELRPSTNALMAYTVLASFGTYRGGSYEECRPSMKRMSERSGLSESTLKRAVAELIDLGVATRVERRYPNGTSAPSVYRLLCPVNAKLPKSPVPAQKEGSTGEPLGGHGRTPTRPPVDPEGFTDGPGRGSPVTHNLEPSDQESETKNPSSSSPAAMIRAATDATEDEAEEIVSLIRSGPPVKSWSGLIKTMTANGDLAAKLADVRAERAAVDAPRKPCGDCDPDTRIIYDENYQPKNCPRCHPKRNEQPQCGDCDQFRRVAVPGGGLTRCPTCHPLRHQPVNGVRSGGNNAYRNPVDQSEYDHWGPPRRKSKPGAWQNRDIPEGAYDADFRT